jgi:hypothetical protein
MDVLRFLELLWFFLGEKKKQREPSLGVSCVVYMLT